ncbi:hypothetical protein LYNGBM3L_44680 [Moorena producens 3L]|uniref:Uncharacterized protein n=1 Tax=Moorena producens 3L TaxID=489825 RepID=F4XWP9_9CYAN|nr:hypothetical protein LYNGBM3L_44680 [Moorena producens 3L]
MYLTKLKTAIQVIKPIVNESMLLTLAVLRSLKSVKIPRITDGI